MKKFEMPKLNLKGSDKQIKWATEIIASLYDTVNTNVRLAQDKQWPHVERWEEAFGRIISQLEAFLEKVDQAGVIIAHRERFDPNRVLFLANKYVNFGK